MHYYSNKYFQYTFKSIQSLFNTIKYFQYHCNHFNTFSIPLNFFNTFSISCNLFQSVKSFQYRFEYINTWIILRYFSIRHILSQYCVPLDIAILDTLWIENFICWYSKSSHSSGSNFWSILCQFQKFETNWMVQILFHPTSVLNRCSKIWHFHYVGISTTRKRIAWYKLSYSW